MRAARDGLHAHMTGELNFATVFAESQNPQHSCCALQARLRNLTFMLSCTDISKAESHASMLWTLMAAVHNLHA